MTFLRALRPGGGIMRAVGEIPGRAELNAQNSILLILYILS